jgi:hypothetical protein
VSRPQTLVVAEERARLHVSPAEGPYASGKEVRGR